MSQFQRMQKLKLAANLVIDTLNAGDFFAVVEFDNNARVVGPNKNTLVSALESTKNEMKQKVDGLSPSGGTDYYNGFQKAFDLLKSSPSQDMTSSCRQAILFVSDGAMNDSPTELYEMIDGERQEYIDKEKPPPVIFTYSFGADAPEDVPKALSCKYDGVWARISDTGDLAGSMGAYYKYFSYGLSDGVNGNFVTWVPPYKFATGDMIGTTVSAPVYNRNVFPPIMAGVVGMDFSFLAMEIALGEESEDARDVIINEIIATNRARCPAFYLDECQRESLRVFGGAEIEEEASCNECSDADQLQDLQSPLCNDARKNRVNVWNNEKRKFWAYEQRTCCNVGEVRDEESLSFEEAIDFVCKENNTTMIAIIAGSIGGGLIVIILILIIFRKKKSSKKLTASAPPIETAVMEMPPSVVPLQVPVMNH